MKKNVTLIAIVVVLLAATLYWFTREKQPEQVQVAQVNDLPNMILLHSDGSRQNAKTLEGKNILVIYFTGCDHCQREATEISNKLKAFDGYHIWFLTTDPFPSMDKFAIDYKLTGYTNVHFAQIAFADVATYFGSIPTPSVYIYSDAKRLVRAIKGETPIDGILMYL